MIWFELLKGRKPISSKLLRDLRKVAESVDGVTVDEILITKKQHLKFKLQYDGPDNPTNEPVKFVVVTSARRSKGHKQTFLRDIQKSLEGKKVYIGEW